MWQHIIVGWKPILFSLFWTLSGISPANRSQFGPKSVHVHRSRVDNVHKLQGAICKVGVKLGAKKCPRRRVFFVSNTRWSFGNFATADFQQIWPWHVNRGWNPDFRQKWKVSIQGSFAPKTPNLEGVKQAPHSEQATGQGMHRREILFTLRCSSRAKEFPRSVDFFIQRTFPELRGIKIAKFSDFCLFCPYKTPKNVPSGDQLTAQVLHRRMISIFPCGSRRSKGVLAV